MSRRKLRLVVMAFALAVMMTLALISVASAEPALSGGYWYQVVPGDTWYGVSYKTGISYSTLWSANPAHQHWNNWLYIGHWLWIPSPPRAPIGYWYQVRSGETWYQLSRNTGYSWWTLWNANPAHQHWNNWLYAGHWVWIP